jgi:Zn-dependent protease with chaperone function
MLVFVFFFIITLWAISLYSVLYFTAPLFTGTKYSRMGQSVPRPFFGLNIFLLLAVSFAAAMVISSIRFIKKIKKGGTTYLAVQLNAVPLPLTREENFLSHAGDEEYGLSLARRLTPLPDAPNFYARAKMLNNVVEELSVAALLPVPDIYILPNQNCINAMAVGPFDDDGAIFVTLGSLKRLTRDELEAMIAHEMSHLRHGDGIFFTHLAGWMHGLVEVSMTGAKLFGPYQTTIFGAALLFLGSLSSVMAKIVQTAYSREREYMADARAVEFTRSKENLAKVLRKIGGLKESSYVKNNSIPLFRHFFLANPERYTLFSTHPPLDERIWTLDPQWDGEYYDFVKNPVDFIKADSAPLPAFPSDLVLPLEPLAAPAILGPDLPGLPQVPPEAPLPDVALPAISLAPFAIVMHAANKAPLAKAPSETPIHDHKGHRPKPRLYAKALEKAAHISQKLKEEAGKEGRGDGRGEKQSDARDPARL